MSVKTPLCYYSGVIGQLQAGDSIANPQTVNNITNGESSAALVMGSPIYMFAADTAKRAEANALATARVVGLWASTSTAPSVTGSFQNQGNIMATTGQWDSVVTGGSGGLVAGAQYYLDDANPGKLVPAASIPSTAGHYICYIGTAIDSTTLAIAIKSPKGL
jgi:hypothetical protein